MSTSIAGPRRGIGAPTAILDTAEPDLLGHLHRLGPMPRTGLVDAIRAAGLTGRGGAGFPAWRKAEAIARTGRAPVVVANGAEGEPASRKDRMLLTNAPHLVLDGLLALAADLHARRTIAYVAPGSGADALRRALHERSAAGLAGPTVEVVEAGDSFLAGEESAVVSALNSGPAIPRDKGIRVVESGVGGHPTLVHNVETLAQLALVGRFGSEWFRRTGTAEEPGTFLATVSGAVCRPAVVEAAYGTTVSQLIGLAGGLREDVDALLIGGFHGAWIPADPALGLPVSRSALAPFGAAPGAGVLIALPAQICGLRYTAEILGYLVGEAAGQCGPCRFGMPRMAGQFDSLVQGNPDPGAAGRLAELTMRVSGRGACSHPDGTVRLVRSALHVFADEITRHRHGRCSAGRSPSVAGTPVCREVGRPGR